MAADGYFKVVNWDTFQHYKDRSPPWIKLYTALLEKYEYLRLPDASKAHLTGIFLLAARLENRIPNDAEFIAQRIGAHSVVNLEVLEAAGFIEFHGRRASKPLALGLHDAMPERERETETDKTARTREATTATTEPEPAASGGGWQRPNETPGSERPPSRGVPTKIADLLPVRSA